MKIVHPIYFDLINVENSIPETLVIENPVYFRKVVEELIEQKNTDCGEFVVSNDNESLLLSKTCVLITDIYNFEEYNRQIKNKVTNMIMDETEYYEKQTKLLSDINMFAIEMANAVPYPIRFKGNITILDVVKMLDFDTDLSDLSFWDKIIEYIKLCSELLNYKLFITVNLKDSISEAEYKAFIEDIYNNQILLLMIERHTHPDIDDSHHLMIVDKDLCVL